MAFGYQCRSECCKRVCVWNGHATRMKKLFFATCVLCLALFASRSASAMTYTNGDLYLIFHEDGAPSDVEFNLGTVSNFLGKAQGTTVTVSNWDYNLAQSSFPGATLDGANF